MTSFKKIALFTLSLTIANSIIADQDITFDSGKVRIAKIMSHEEEGIAAYNKKHINYAETQNLAHDLNIPAIAKSFGCKTVMGESFLAETLQCPVNPKDRDTVLKHRQQVIKALVENPELKQQVDEFITRAQEHEQEVIQLMSDFFMGQTCPELAGLELLKEQKHPLYSFAHYMHTNPTAKMVGTTLGIVGLAGGIAGTYYLGNATYQLARAGQSYTKLALWTGYLGLASCFSTYGLYKDVSTAVEKRNKMHSVNQLVQIAESIEKLCKEHHTENQFNISSIKNTNGLEMIKGVKHARYKDKYSLAFLTPYVHTFLYKIYEEDKHLAQVFACIAEMDAYNAIATKIVESRTTQNKFCFATFSNNAKPTINAKAFWNVLVENAVTSDLSENKHIILTGPNAGGKTTAIRALLQNIVVGQSFGVAAAESFEFTMFDEIHSYLNISDDLINGLSLFASEIKRAQEIVQKIKSLEPHKKFFFALDELFTGTVAEDGETCAYEFIKRIAEFNNVLFVYATHFNKLKELGKDNTFCANYKVDAPTKNTSGKLVYPYTLSQGANESRVALDMARQANLFA